MSAMPEIWTWDPPEIMAPRNRRLIAERTGEPAGSVELCERVEATFPAQPDDRFPGLNVSWLDESTTEGFAGPAGFYATVAGTGSTWGWRPRAAYGATEAELIESCHALLERHANDDAWRVT